MIAPQNTSRSGQNDPYPTQKPPIRVNEYNGFGSKQATDKKVSSSGMMNSFGASRAWNDGIFNPSFATKTLGSAQSQGESKPVYMGILAIANSFVQFHH
jgi:hypothetical protein